MKLHSAAGLLDRLPGTGLESGGWPLRAQALRRATSGYDSVVVDSGGEAAVSGVVHTPSVAPEVDRAGRSPLHYAALEGRIAGVSAHLQDGADVNLADKAGFTPLHFAAQEQHIEAVRVLLGAGVDVHARNRFGNTPLLVALSNVRDRDGVVVCVLLDAGSDPGAENSYGVSPRGLAAMVANYDLMRFFRS